MRSSPTVFFVGSIVGLLAVLVTGMVLFGQFSPTEKAIDKYCQDTYSKTYSGEYRIGKDYDIICLLKSKQGK